MTRRPAAAAVLRAAPWLAVLAAVLFAARASIFAAWLPRRDALLGMSCWGCGTRVPPWRPGAGDLSGRYCRACIKAHFADVHPAHHCAVCA